MLRQLQQSALHAHYATELRAGLDALLRPTGRLSHCFKAVNHILATTAAMGRQPAPAEGLAVLEAQVERRCVYIYTNVYLSIHLSIYRSIYLSGWLSLRHRWSGDVCIYIPMSIYLSIHVSIWLSLRHRWSGCSSASCICIYVYMYI